MKYTVSESTTSELWSCGEINLSLCALLFEELKGDKNKVKLLLLEVTALAIAATTGDRNHARG